MEDFENNEIMPNDEVVFIYKSLTGGVCLMRGIVEKIERGKAYIASTYNTLYNYNPKDPNNIIDYGDGKNNQVKVGSKSIFKIKKDV